MFYRVSAGHDRGALPYGENLPVPTSRTITAALSTDSYSSAPLFASPGTDVSDTRSDLPGLATAFSLSSGFWRSAYCRAGFCLYLLGTSQLDLCADSGMGFQCVWDARFT